MPALYSVITFIMTIQSYTPNSPKGKLTKRARKQIVNRRRHEFLLTFFNKSKRYATKEVNGYILVRQFNAGTGLWDVAIHTKETWGQVNNWKQKQTLDQAELL